MGVFDRAADQIETELDQAERRIYPSPGELAKALDPATVQTPALDLLDARLTAVERGEITRLIWSMPPQEGKVSASAAGSRSGCWRGTRTCGSVSRATSSTPRAGGAVASAMTSWSTPSWGCGFARTPRPRRNGSSMGTSEACTRSVSAAR